MKTKGASMRKKQQPKEPVGFRARGYGEEDSAVITSESTFWLV